MQGPDVLRPGIDGEVWLGLLLALLLVFVPELARGQGTTRSPHGRLNFECNACHTSDRWVPISRQAGFRHERVGFPLEGAHGQVSCRGCHGVLVFAQVASACIDCHKDPHHGQLGSRCEACHSPRTFETRLDLFRVHDRAQLVLFSRHVAVACVSCHGAQRPTDFASTPTDCAYCHQRTAAQTKDPNHALAGFTRACEGCHASSRGWRPTSFQHPPSFPLRAAHGLARCAACHNQRFRGTPRECVSCHLEAYNNTRNPNHLASGFPTDCEACHRETGFRPANFDHDARSFPIFSGKHRGVWQGQCNTCHVAPPNYRAFECILCHQHADKPRVDGRHRNLPGYAYVSAACYRCHPAGSR